MRLFAALNLACIALVLFVSPVNAQDNTVKVVNNVTGQGVNYRAAMHTAFRNAIESVMGVKIKSETKVLNFQVVSDLIFSKSEGFILDKKGERVTKADGLVTVFYTQVLVSASALNINERIAHIENIFRNFRSPGIGLKLDNCARSYRPYIQSVITDVLKRDIERDYEILIIPFVESSGEKVTMHAQLEDKKGNVLAVVKPMTLAFEGDNSREYMSQVLVINLLLAFKESQKYILTIVGVPNVTVAEKIRTGLENLEVIRNCSLKRFDRQGAIFYVWCRVALSMLSLQLDKVFGRVVFDEPSRAFKARWGRSPQEKLLGWAKDSQPGESWQEQPAPDDSLGFSGDSAQASIYHVYFAYFQSSNKLNQGYRALKALQSDGMLRIVKFKQPHPRSMVWTVSYPQPIFELKQELERMCRTYGMFLRFRFQGNTIIVTQSEE